MKARRKKTRSRSDHRAGRNPSHLLLGNALLRCLHDRLLRRPATVLLKGSERCAFGCSLLPLGQWISRSCNLHRPTHISGDSALSPCRHPVHRFLLGSVCQFLSDDEHFLLGTPTIHGRPPSRHLH
uniref:Uncharacterized protein n=1 Tax=Steinernema glaseri TaxID=37863 RepID=A0A1I7YKE0_9BILA